SRTVSELARVHPAQVFRLIGRQTLRDVPSHRDRSGLQFPCEPTGTATAVIRPRRRPYGLVSNAAGH
ncbi:MAG: hypothetical protein ACOYOM_13620, partial [Chloroflexota bacterium]